MAVPKRKVTPMKAGHRRSGHRKETVTVSPDPQTGEYRRPHHVDLKSGTYRGRKVFDIVDDSAAKTEVPA